MLTWGGLGVSLDYNLATGGSYRLDPSLDADKDGYTQCAGDCNDADPAIHPGATEACNGIDDDCNGEVDEIPPSISCLPGVAMECPVHNTALARPAIEPGCDSSLAVSNDAPDELGLGTTQVTWTVVDSRGRRSSCRQPMTVVDTTPPAIVCPSVGPVECSGPGGSGVSLAATAGDLCGSTLSMTNSRTGSGPDASAFYPLGTTAVTFTAIDASGNRATCGSSVQVRDTTPPSLSLTVNPATLWPPNHRLVPIQASLQVNDACDPSAGAILSSVTNSEADDAPGGGDGNTTQDVQDASLGTLDTTVWLRAERWGDGPGRIYSLTYAAMDASGNASLALGSVPVPHDLGTGPEPVMMRVEGGDAPGMARLFWNVVPGAEMYDVIQGDISQVTHSEGKTWLGFVHVLATGQGATSLSEGSTGAIPSAGDAFFYLVQYRDAKGASGWGTESSPWPVQPASCDVACPGEMTTSSASSSGAPRTR